MKPFREVIYDSQWTTRIPLSRFIITADIGGTNSNFGIVECGATGLLLCASFHVRSQQVHDYHQLIFELINQFEARYGVSVTTLALGAAGIVGPERSFVRPTNLAIEISIATLQEKLKSCTIYLMNDFEAAGLGIPHITSSSLITVQNGTHRPGAQRAIIGAGTGLGKAALLWNRRAQVYIPMASEGGHADSALRSPVEQQLATHFSETWLMGGPVTWEDLLSGAGLSRIYQFLAAQRSYPATAITEEIKQHNFQPDLISHYAQQDPCCLETWKLYVRFYARCTKSFALDTASLDGIYIAGGIAAKNVGMFGAPVFSEEFLLCNKQHWLLRAMPVYVIADYNINLYGAAAYALLSEQGIL